MEDKNKNVVPMEEPKKKQLKEVEFLQLEIKAKDRIISDLQQRVLALSIAEARANQTIAEYMQKDLSQKEAALKSELKDLLEKTKKQDEQRQAFIGKIKERHGIEGGFGYNPETHEIIEDQ